MNIFKHKLARSQRHGLSVIEVLTSIVVALIGVFGVLAMIPFSVKQTQSGLDQDAATSMARNALTNFEASGYKIATEIPGSTTRQLNWIHSTTDAAGNIILANITTSANDPVVNDPVLGINAVCIDPLGILEGNVLDFPFNNTPLLSSVTLALPGVQDVGGVDMPIPFTLADARRMFRLTDDLVFEQADNPNDPNSDLNGPRQVFNEGLDAIGNVVRLNRQSNGTVSWCAIAEPVVNNPSAEEIDTYKLHLLVFKDRLFDDLMETTMVNSPTMPAQLSTIEINKPLKEFENEIRRNDWVMLYNTGADKLANIAFARITNSFDSSNDANNPTQTSSLTLDGPDFDFSTPTTFIHLKDVVAVFSRTIKLETNSAWTVSTD